MLNLFYLLLFSFVLLGDNSQDVSYEDHDRILFVVSNADFYGDSNIPTSNHFAELVYPFDEFVNEGYKIDFVSPEGGAIPIGYLDTSEPLIKQYLYDCDFMSQLKNTLRPSQIVATDYKAIYYGGGGASMFVVPEDTEILKIAQEIYEKQKGVVAAVCHGSAGIANIQLSDGSYLVEGKNVNGFPDHFENKEAKYFAQFPYSVEGILKKRGANYHCSKEGWDGFFQKDGRIVTGQDPSSARKVAEITISILENKI